MWISWVKEVFLAKSVHILINAQIFGILSCPVCIAKTVKHCKGVVKISSKSIDSMVDVWYDSVS
jgi:hypothetical protein